MSFQQSVFHGVPVIINPFGGDQTQNARTAEKLGFGIHLEVSEITLEKFTATIHELINNPKYAQILIPL